MIHVKGLNALSPFFVIFTCVFRSFIYNMNDRLL